LSEYLIESVKALTVNRKKHGIGHLEYVLSVLKQGTPIFSNVQKKGVLAAGMISENMSISEARLDLRRMDKQKQLRKVLEIFVTDFKTLALPLNVTIRDYVLFLMVCLKLIRKMKTGHQRSLIFAQTLADLNQMFVYHPAQYNKRAIKEPLELLFLVTQFVSEANQCLESPYEIDEITMSQFVTLMTKYCITSENPILEIAREISKIPKFRLNIVVGQEHQKIIENILRYCFTKIPPKIRIETTRKLFGRIISEDSDASVLTHYNTLKLLLADDMDIIEQTSKLANAEIIKTRHNRFVNGILGELVDMCKKSQA
jgi:hypothetical protein